MFIFATKKMYEIMKEICLISLGCDSQYNVAKLIDNPDRSNIKGISSVISIASPVIERVPDKHLIISMFITQMMI